MTFIRRRGCPVRSRYVTSALFAFTSLLVTLAPAPLAAAQSSGQQKIEPALLSEMTAYPTESIPVIVEMAPATAPFSSGSNMNLANQAVSILNANGHAFGALSVIQGAAGVATSTGITAMSLLPQVATIQEDAVVRPRRPSSSGPTYPPGQLTSLFPQETNATRVWQQGGSGRGVSVAVLDSGVANDVDLVQNGNRVLVHVGFAGAYNASQPDGGGHGTHIAGTI